MRLISNEEYDQLVADQRLLNALQAAGVDNWDGYDYAMEALEEDDEDDFLVGKTCNPDAPEECESCQ